VGSTRSKTCHVHALFDAFVQAATCRETLRAFQELCEELKLHPGGQPQFYHTLRSRLHYWKAKALWAKLDKRASQREYMRGHACTSTTCLIIGAGPCGLRTAIELRFLGARVVLVEKRDAFSRNNVLHLWPFTIQDLRGLGAKKFYGKFCAGAIDHISIRQLQLILLKVALLLGIEIHVNVEFKHLVEPPEDQEKRVGWRAEVHPNSHPVSQLEFDVVIGADGRRNTLPGFRRKEFRGKLAIAITANFINRNTTAEAKVEEISGVAFIFNQRFFQDLRQATGIDLENIVYYKDDTHYFVMTAKKQSLLEKGVILHDYADTEMLLSRNNVDQNALLSYAHEAADFSTNHQLPTLDFAINHYGQADVAMFDFTCMYASENAAMVRQRRGHPLLVALVGDSLLEPFWPMGTGIARGFLAAMDTAWMVRSWGQGNTPSQVLAERESVYRLLPQTTPENVSKNHSQYSMDPASRYPNINMQLVGAAQVCHLIDTGEGPVLSLDAVSSPHPRLTRQESVARYSKLLSWCQEQTLGYMNVCVTDFTTSWRSGLALCALIHRFRPDLIDFASLEESEAELNGQLGLDMAEQEFGICPIMTGKEMSTLEESDSLSMVMYLSQLYELLKDTAPAGGQDRALSGSRKEFPVNMGGSDVCYFCGRRVYVMERLSAEGKFFHRSCFQCDHCSTTLRLSNYAYDQLHGVCMINHFSVLSVFKILYTSSDGESKPCDQQQQEESPPSLKPPESGPTPTPELSTNPENPPVKSLEVVEEFWLKSAEIRKSLGLTPLPRECDPKHTAAQTSNIKENFYTSVTYIPSCNTNSAYQMPRNCDSSTQTQSQSTSPPEPSHTTDGDAAVLPTKAATPVSSCPSEVVGVWVVFPDPSSISFCTTLFQRAETEEELNAKLTRRVQRAVHRQAKQEELRRLHRAQIIQRQLEQVEVKQRQLEEKGVAVEKALRGEAGMGKKDDPSLMHQWFKLVQEKNALVRYESELMIFARELELEDRQSRLQQELRERMAVDDHLKGEDELVEERRILSEMLDVVEQRDALVVLLEEQRVREKEEDSDLEAVMLSKGFSLHWD
uniref:F-actin monooxygenase n=1 Tax=Cyprinus carpio TaxID=7962 RepID=A0A8C1Y6J2_CYPCA